jgi:hypothetical protein
VAQIALTRRRSAYGWGARLAAFLNSLGFAFALGIGAIQECSYESTPIFSNGIGDDTALPLLCALPNEGIKDFSKQEKAFSWNPGEVIGSRAVDALSAITRSASLMCREQHPLPLKLLPSAEPRASGNSSTDPA